MSFQGGKRAQDIRQPTTAGATRVASAVTAKTWIGFIAMTPATTVGLLRCAGGNIKKIAEKTRGISKPPQKPWMTRAGTIDQKPVARAQATLERVKPTTPARKAPRVDITRVSQPVNGMATTSAMRYDVCIQLN
jgi:hypothetical protein